jgi:hypothetical protein
VAGLVERCRERPSATDDPDSGSKPRARGCGLSPQGIDDGVFLKGLHKRFKYLALNRASGTDHAWSSMAMVTDVATEYLKR